MIFAVSNISPVKQSESRSTDLTGKFREGQDLSFTDLEKWSPESSNLFET